MHGAELHISTQMIYEKSCLPLWSPRGGGYIAFPVQSSRRFVSILREFCHSPHCRLFTYARLSLHLIFVLSLPLLQTYSVSYALFVNLSSHIPSTFSAHCSLFPTTLLLRCIFIPIYYLISAIFLLSSNLN